ncbi:cholinesterase [Parasteatoda tepidariorum]|uniref:cholinesterase n=1 Tax=Parasteatoda tepidariorum TaxID=114398 RepID=UPI00077FA98F|nr:cholinesterase [Parasteatoda tepidariorum]
MNFITSYSVYSFIILVFPFQFNCQILRNHYSGIFNDDLRDRQYSNDRYYPGDRYNFMDRSNPIRIGYESEYSDSRCVGNRSPTYNLDSSVTVRLSLGDVTGTYVFLCDGPGQSEYDRPNSKYAKTPKVYKNITVFLGIPYALPPTQELRFRPPQVQPSFKSKYALQYRSACLQHPQYTGIKFGITDTSEDCLNLNVFSPSVKGQNEKYAVMVYIHGGEWHHGSGKTFPAHMLVASQSVVVVTFNYRLGALGFYANGQESSPGNYGLFDQALAIEWVYDNIGAFNGDNERITLFGPGSGAASAGIHALSARLGKKIRRVIAQSGSAVADWAVTKSNYTVFNNSIEYALLLNCYFQSSWRTVSCLQSLPSSLFETKLFEPKTGWLSWNPVIDLCTRERNKRILPDSPENMLRTHYENLHDDFSYLAGVTTDEAATMFLVDPEIKKNNYVLTVKKFKEKIQEYSSIFNYTLDIAGLTKAIEFMYVPAQKNLHNQTLLREGYINMLSDSYFVAPNNKMMKLLLERNIRTYAYVLNGSLEGLESMRSYHPLKNITPHDIEYFLITGSPFMDPRLFPSGLNLQEARWTEADRNLSQLFMQTWANFAKFGNPTPAKVFNITWEPANIKNMQYLLINTTNFTSVMRSNYRQKESQFWSDFLPTLMKGQFSFPTTYCQPEYEIWQNQKRIYQASLWGTLGIILLIIVLCVLCSFLYCRAKSKHVVSTEDIPDSVSSVSPYSMDSLLHNMKRSESSNKYLTERLHVEQKHTQV